MDRLADHLADLFVLVRVVELKSFSKAAQATGATKSTVSKQVRRLEEALGAKLLHRTTRHLALTEAGELAYRHGLRIVEQAGALRSSVDSLQEAPRGHLRVTTSVAFGNLHLSGLVAQFLARYPDITVTLSLSDRYVDVVEEGFDVAIRLTSTPVDSLVARRLAALDYVVCATPAYLAAHARIVAPADLTAHNCMVNGQGLEDTWRFTREEESTDVRVTARLAVNSSESVRQAVLQGIGVGLLPTYAVAADLHAGDLVVVLPAYRVEGRFGNSVHAIFAPSRFNTPKMRVFIDFLLERFGAGAGLWSGPDPVASD